MSTVVITITDIEDDRVDVKVEFGTTGLDQSSGAHRTAIDMLATAGWSGDAAPQVISNG